MRPRNFATFEASLPDDSVEADAYVDTFKAHVNVGFFCGAELPDPKSMLEGSGKRMRHVKIRPGSVIDAVALSNLISSAYADMKRRVQNEKPA